MGSISSGSGTERALIRLFCTVPFRTITRAQGRFGTGVVVPRSKVDLAKDILAREYRRQVGVEPMLTVEMDAPVVADRDF